MKRLLRGLTAKVLTTDSKGQFFGRIREYSPDPANKRSFDLDGKKVTIAVGAVAPSHRHYLTKSWCRITSRKTHSVSLRYPFLGCVRLTAKAWYPIEVVEINSVSEATQNSSGNLIRLQGNALIEKLNTEQLKNVLNCKSVVKFP